MDEIAENVTEVTVPTIKNTNTKILDSAREAVNAYLIKNIVSDFSNIPTFIKMSFLQETPDKFIKTRKIDNFEVPYVDHFYAERALNFISNYRWGSEVIKSSIEEKEMKTKNGIKTMWEAMVEMKMWIFLDGHRIERYIASGHNMYTNPAITKADALQSAISKANTKFARQLGMGANVISREGNAYDKISEFYEEVDIIPGEVLENPANAKIENGKIQGAVAKVFQAMKEDVKKAKTVFALEKLLKRNDDNFRYNLLDESSYNKLKETIENKISKLNEEKDGKE